MVKIASKLSGIQVKSANPKFNYRFKEADEPLEVSELHAEKVLKNDNFYISKKDVAKPKKIRQNKPKPAKTWKSELDEIEELDVSTVEEVIKAYPTKDSLLKAISKKEKLNFKPDIVKKLEEAFVH